MKIHGLQKLTLLDYPGKTACTVFLGGCDLRCPYCHNAELLDGSADALMEEDELLAFLETRRGLLDGVAVTGGEPLLRPELPELLARIRERGFAVKLDTNGTHPEALRRVVEAGLVDYAAMDVKNSPARYAETVGVPDFDLAPVRESAAFLLSGAVEYEFRTTVVRELHDEESFEEIGRWLRGAARCFLQPFADRDSVPFAGLHAPDEAALRRYAEILRGNVREVAVRAV